MAQIFKASCIAYFTKSSEIDSLSAPVNQTRGDKGAEKSTFSSVRHNPNCLPYQVFSLIFFKFHETSSQYYLPVIFFCFMLIAHLLEYVIKWSKERIVSYPYLYLPLTYLLCPGRHLQFSHHLSNWFKVLLMSCTQGIATEKQFTFPITKHRFEDGSGVGVVLICLSSKLIQTICIFLDLWGVAARVSGEHFRWVHQSHSLMLSILPQFYLDWVEALLM